MNLLKELLSEILVREGVTVTISGSVHVPSDGYNIEELVESECFMILKKIKAVITNDSFSDFECVENIVRIFEQAGISGGNRHDFG